MARLKAHTHNPVWPGAGLLAGILVFSGCTTGTSGPPAQQVQQEAAQDAQQVRHDLKDAGREAKQALQQARVETKAAVAGAREGWKAGAPRRDGNGVVDINHASLTDLEALPGIGGREARRIVAARPYSSAHQLESRGVLSHAEYDRISSDVSAQE
jgi:DNA uptake protein ComE-like DNA-binding protein